MRSLHQRVLKRFCFLVAGSFALACNPTLTSGSADSSIEMNSRDGAVSGDMSPGHRDSAVVDNTSGDLGLSDGGGSVVLDSSLEAAADSAMSNNDAIIEVDSLVMAPMDAELLDADTLIDVSPEVDLGVPDAIVDMQGQCGDGIRNGSEECDDGNEVTDVCAYGETACTVCAEDCTERAGAVSYCGDGIRNGSEECDDGDLNDDDGCTRECLAAEIRLRSYALTFNVRMAPGYDGGVTLGNSIDGWDMAGAIQLQDDDGDGVYTGTMLVTEGVRIEFKYIQGYDGAGTWENVPSECGYVTGDISNRSLVMPSENVVLPVVNFGTCDFDSGEVVQGPFAPSDISGDCTPSVRRVRFRVNTENLDLGQNVPCVFGTFNDWATSQHPMTDTDGDGIFELELSVPTDALEFKYHICNTDRFETFANQESCTLQTGDYINRLLTSGEADTVLDAHCFETCGACAGEDPTAFEHPWSVCPDQPGRAVPIAVAGRRMVENGSTMHLKGVAWQPYGIGQGPTGNSSPPWASSVEQDSALMVTAGINGVRTYGVITDRSVLDRLYERGIHVLMTVFYGYGDTPETAIQHVCALKDHPAISGWLVGNEWNLNNLGRPINFEQASDDVEQAVRAIRMNDDTRPVSTVYGGLPSRELLSCLSEVEVWGLNIYTGASFGDLFSQWEALSTRPMYFGEYGADAFDARVGRENESLQADIVESLTNEIHGNSARIDGVCSGGMIFEFSDEWWKYASGSWSEHDTANSWENGAYPDPGMQEEWWGLVRIDRTQREAFTRYGQLNPPQ